MRWRNSWALVAAICLALIFIKTIRPTSDPGTISNSRPPYHGLPTWNSETAEFAPSTTPFVLTSTHPIAQLVSDAQHSFQLLKANQSTSLAQAVAEYKRRYGINPPPLFDKWYHFAIKRGVQLIDEYDTIMDSMLPFWALSPKTVRTRAREALGYDGNGLIALLIRNGKAAKIERGPDWQRTVTLDMIEDFAHMLPDMDVAFNIHDEPRVVVPHDELSKMVAFAKNEALPAALATVQPHNSFSTSPEDLDDATRGIKEIKVTRFNEYAHQSTWVPSRMSCSADSPARDYHDNVKDNTAAYALEEDLGFIYNHTAMTDICNTASLRDSFGFFNRPNAFKIAHELIPIFSQSKVSSFQDILYPSPWYHYGKTVTDKPPETHQVQLNETMDMDWDAKNTTFWWRGSTTGGFSRDGGWRDQHRQQFVSRISAQNNAKVLVNQGTETAPHWVREIVPREKYKDLMDIHFSGVGQCDPGDCDAQLEFFEMATPVNPQQAWSYKFLLDIDGNAFSGRFYSFLNSKSLALKMSMFREWHEEWLLPWVHYIPLSLKGDEHLEVVRYLATEEEGMKIASSMATQSREWSGKVLRNQDLEVWFFRLLLEYGRVIDDNRESIGFGG